MTAPNDEALQGMIDTCVGCGFCLEACPTYRTLGLESASPRGRISIMNGLLNGDLEVNAAATKHLDLCLGCRGCEPACPSGVPYGRILESTRARLHGKAPVKPTSRLISAFLRWVMPRRWVLAPSVFFLTLLNRIGLLQVLRPLLPGRLKTMIALLPEPDGPAYQALDEGSGKPAVLFLGCIQREIFPEVHRATRSLLLANEHRVLHPKGMGCCGALHLHNGVLDPARDLARKNIAAFEKVNDPEAVVVVNAAGCGSALKDYGELFEGDPVWGERAEAFSSRVRDWSEVITHSSEDLGGAPVAYQDACHLAHAQRISEEPRALLKAAGAELVSLGDESLCCGSAGIYNLMQPEMARSLQQRKCDHVESCGVSTLAVANPGCHIQMESGLRERGSKIRVVHPVRILAGRGPGGLEEL